MRLITDVQYLTNQELPKDAEAYVKELLPKIELTERIVQENIRDSQQKSKEYYDRNSEIPTFAVGDKVWLYNMRRKVGQSKKMYRYWTGPYIITQMGEKNWYKLRHAKDGSLIGNTVHSNRLKKYISEKDVFHTKVADAVQRENLRKNSETNEQKQSSTKDNGQERGRKKSSTKEAAKENWFPLDYLARKRGSGKNIQFEVVWKDGTKSWQKAADISDFAKQMYFKRMEQERRRSPRKA
jgi:hypothetical protein